MVISFEKLDVDITGDIVEGVFGEPFIISLELNNKAAVVFT
jgi:hypothetical protein